MQHIWANNTHELKWVEYQLHGTNAKFKSCIYFCRMITSARPVIKLQAGELGRQCTDAYPTIAPVGLR